MPPFHCFQQESLPGAIIYSALYCSLFQLVSYLCIHCLASMIFHKEVAKWNLSCSVSGRLKLHGEWYTLWGQEFLANWNLLLVTGPSRLHQKIIEKKCDLMVDHSFFMMQLIYVWSDHPWSTYSLLVDHWHAMWNAIFDGTLSVNNKEKCASIPVHFNINGIGSWGDPFFQRA